MGNATPPASQLGGDEVRMSTGHPYRLPTLPTPAVRHLHSPSPQDAVPRATGKMLVVAVKQPVSFTDANGDRAVFFPLQALAVVISVSVVVTFRNFFL